MRIFGRKSRGSNIGKKQSSFKKGVKSLGLALVAGAGIYAATQSGDKEVKDTEEEQRNQVLEQQREKLAAEGAQPAPPPAVEFGQGNNGGKLDKAKDVLQIAGIAIDAAQDIDSEKGKFGKAKAVVGGIKDVKKEADNIGKQNIQGKFEAGLLTDQQAKKFISKQQKEVEGKKRDEDCDKKFPAGSGFKVAGKNKACKKGLVKQT